MRACAAQNGGAVAAASQYSGLEPLVAKTGAHSKFGEALAWSNDGLRIATVARDRSLKIWLANFELPSQVYITDATFTTTAALRPR